MAIIIIIIKDKKEKVKVLCLEHTQCTRLHMVYLYATRKTTFLTNEKMPQG